MQFIVRHLSTLQLLTPEGAPAGTLHSTLGHHTRVFGSTLPVLCTDGADWLTLEFFGDVQYTMRLDIHPCDLIYASHDVGALHLEHSIGALVRTTRTQQRHLSLPSWCRAAGVSANGQIFVAGSSAKGSRIARLRTDGTLQDCMSTKHSALTALRTLLHSPGCRASTLLVGPNGWMLPFEADYFEGSGFTLAGLWRSPQESHLLQQGGRVHTHGLGTGGFLWASLGSQLLTQSITGAPEALPSPARSQPGLQTRTRLLDDIFLAVTKDNSPSSPVHLYRTSKDGPSRHLAEVLGSACTFFHPQPELNLPVQLQ